MIGDQQQVSAQQLIGFAFQRLADPVSEKTDGSQGRNRNHQRGHQQAQLARTGVATEHAQGKSEKIHIGKRLGLVTRIAGLVPVVEKRFKPVSSRPGIERLPAIVPIRQFPPTRVGPTVH